VGRPLVDAKFSKNSIKFLMGEGVEKIMKSVDVVYGRPLRKDIRGNENVGNLNDSNTFEGEPNFR